MTVSEAPPKSGAAAEHSSRPMSLLATRIVQEAVRDGVSVADLSKLAMGDPGFAARILAMVNGPTFGLRIKVADARQACSLLGARGLRNVALSLAVDGMVPTNEDGAVLLAMSIRRAVAAQLIAGALGESKPDDAFTMGLFLEIGLLSAARVDLAGAAQVARMPAGHRLVLERAFGFEEHPIAGAKLVQSMRLPAEVIESIAHHHDIEMPAKRESAIAWAAERVAGAWEGGDLSRVKQDARAALTAVGVPEHSIDPLLQRVPELVTATAAIFDRKLEAQVDLEALSVDAGARLVELNAGYEQLVRSLERLIKEKEALAADLRAATARFADLAATDELTKLPNRRAFNEAIARDLARADRSATYLGLVMLDVDHFKKLNDAFGHPVGDLVLAKIGETLRTSLRTGDLAARYGGEEFVILLHGADTVGAGIAAERIRARLETASVNGPKGPVRMTASFGAAVVKGPGCVNTAESVIRRADEALYEAKRGGRNRVVVAK